MKICRLFLKMSRNDVGSSYRNDASARCFSNRCRIYWRRPLKDHTRRLFSRFSLRFKHIWPVYLGGGFAYGFVSRSRTDVKRRKKLRQKKKTRRKKKSKNTTLQQVYCCVDSHVFWHVTQWHLNIVDGTKYK